MLHKRFFQLLWISSSSSTVIINNVPPLVNIRMPVTSQRHVSGYSFKKGDVRLHFVRILCLSLDLDSFQLTEQVFDPFLLKEATVLLLYPYIKWHSDICQFLLKGMVFFLKIQSVSSYPILQPAVMTHGMTDA